VLERHTAARHGFPVSSGSGPCTHAPPLHVFVAMQALELVPHEVPSAAEAKTRFPDCGSHVPTLQGFAGSIVGGGLWMHAPALSHTAQRLAAPPHGAPGVAVCAIAPFAGSQESRVHGFP